MPSNFSSPPEPLPTSPYVTTLPSGEAPSVLHGLLRAHRTLNPRVMSPLRRVHREGCKSLTCAAVGPGAHAVHPDHWRITKISTRDKHLPSPLLRSSSALLVDEKLTWGHPFRASLAHAARQTSAVTADAVPRIRRTAIPDDAVLAVRGDDPMSVLTADARRFRRRFADWNRYGVSGFVARDADEVDALCETRLAAWATVRVFRRAAVEGAGIEVVPTFRTPHVALAHAELEELLGRLERCEHQMIENPYHEGESSPPET